MSLLLAVLQRKERSTPRNTTDPLLGKGSVKYATPRKSEDTPRESAVTPRESELVRDAHLNLSLRRFLYPKSAPLCPFLGGFVANA